MSSINKSHFQHTELISEIAFQKTEINFLMKVLRNAYCVHIEDDRVKKLDSFWKTLESYAKELDLLFNRVKREERMARITEDELTPSSNITINENIIVEDSIEDRYRVLYKKIRAYKEEFYHHMMDCKDCLIKKNNS